LYAQLAKKRYFSLFGRIFAAKDQFWLVGKVFFLLQFRT